MRQGPGAAAAVPDRVVGVEHGVQDRLLGGVHAGLEQRVQVGTAEPGALGRVPRGARMPTERPRKISPDPWWATDPARASPRPIRVASRRHPSVSSGASVTTTPRQEPAGGGDRPRRPPAGTAHPRHRAPAARAARDGSSSPTGPASAPPARQRPSSRSHCPKLVSSRTPTVCPEGSTREAVPTPPFQPRHSIPVPAPTAPVCGRTPDPTDSRAASARRRDVVELDLHRTGEAQPRVVALPDDRDDHVVGDARGPRPGRSGRPRRRPDPAASWRSGRSGTRPGPTPGRTASRCTPRPR